MTAQPPAASSPEAELAALKAEKEVWEKLALERGRALAEVRKNLAGLMNEAGPRLDELRRSLPEEPPQTAAEGEEGGADDFSRYQAQAFKILGDERRWYKSVLDSLPFSSSVFDPERRWIYLNPAAARVLGGEPADFIGRPYAEGWKNYLDSQELDDSDDIMTRRFTRRLENSKRVFSGHTSILDDGPERGIGSIETFIDITKAQEAEERVRLMLDATPLACCFFDRRGTVVDCNQEAAALCGFKSKKKYMEHFFESMPPYLPDGRVTSWALMTSIGQAFEQGRAFMPEMALLAEDGTVIPGEANLIRVEWRDEYTVLGYFRDLRSLKAAQNKLDRERLLLRDILNGCPVPFGVIAGEKIEFVTPFAQMSLGLSPGDPLAKLALDRNELLDLKRELETGQPVNWRPLKARKPDGSMSENLLNAYRAEYEDRPAVMAWLMDVTQLRRNERELSVARDQAEASLRAKSDFLANISHEIFTPMNAVIGFTNLLMGTELNAQQLDFVKKTDSAAKSLLHMINDILDFSDIEAGQLELVSQEFYLQNVLKSAVETVSGRTGEKGLEFMVNVSPDAPVGLVGDERRLLQTLNSLLDNAVKFTDRGEVALTVETVQEKESEVTLRFLIRDTGVGLEPERIENLFAPFTQADTSFTRRYGGCGLGLAISKSLVSLMGGKIWCESAPGQGSLFGFTARFGRHNRELRFISRLQNFTGLSALIVDDNALSRAILENYLKAFGFEVAVAASGEEALNFLNKSRSEGRNVDLVTMDLKMPGWDGLETTRRLNELAPPGQRPVVIMTTAYSRAEVVTAAAQAGIKTVLEKPLSATALRQVLAVLFEQAAAQGEVRGPDISPAEQKKKLAEAAKGEEVSALIGRLAGARILLVEDNEINQLVAKKILKKAGLDVSVAGNGREALDMVMSGAYDLVLMDIQMPVMDGLTAAREIRRMDNRADLPIVALTAHSMPEDREKSLSAGMNDHITKPLDVNDLFHCLLKWIKPESRDGG